MPDLFCELFTVNLGRIPAEMDKDGYSSSKELSLMSTQGGSEHERQPIFNGQGEAQTAGADNPTGGIGPPTAGADNLTGGIGPPTPGADNPTGGIGPPTPGADNPAGGTGPPTPGADNPAGGTGPPTPGADNPIGGAQPPAAVSWKKVILRLTYYIILLLMGLLMFVCTVSSKISFVHLTNRLRLLTWCKTSNSTEIECIDEIPDINQAVSIYWFLMLILMVPNLFTFLRSFLLGVMWKSSSIHPWPTCISFSLGLLVTIAEVWVVCILVLYGFSRLPLGMALLAVNSFCVFQAPPGLLLQIGKDISNIRKYHKGYIGIPVKRQNNVPEVNIRGNERLKLTVKIYGITVIHIMIFFAALAYIVLFILLDNVYSEEDVPTVHVSVYVAVMALCIFFLALIWSEKVQGIITVPRTSKENKDKTIATTRFKSSFLYSIIRLLCYPFFMYVTFCFITSYKLDPWCLDNSCTINLQNEMLPAFLVQVFTTFGGYVIAWLACAMTLQKAVFFAVLASIPFVTNIGVGQAVPFFFGNITQHSNLNILNDGHFGGYVLIGILGPLTIFFVMAPKIWQLFQTKGQIMPIDSVMFYTPHYNSLFFDQHLFQNIKFQSKKTQDNNGCKIFICLPMYRESEDEMRQVLTSLKQLSQANDGNNYQCHIVFDNGMDGNSMQEFATQLVRLINDVFEVTEPLRKYYYSLIMCNTSYGVCIKWTDNLPCPLFVHLKDEGLVKKKKRWSQVMYMMMIMESLNNQELNNSFILTMDGDVKFDYNSMNLLLDRMKSNPKVGGVCARILPHGSGPLYWYQKFEYAVGHWLQKTTEDLMGCVLCCPGCFSMLRCSALKMILEQYSEPAKSGFDFLMKNMGEDRWLCSLLLEKGWRLVYCAISPIYTNCPESFEVFFNQRRRWISSTVANLISLVRHQSKITTENSCISLPFILYQILNILSTLISPATVIFVISTGLQSAYDLNETTNQIIIVGIVFIGIFYGLVCVFTSDKTQTDVAKILTLVFVLLMALVIVGLAKELIHFIPHQLETTLTPPNCSSIINDTKKYEDCEKAREYINSLITDERLLPVTTNLLYLLLFMAIFVVTAILHFSECTSVFSSLVYFLTLPTGYYLLPIYCAANLTNQSWGTREKKSKEDKGLFGLLKKWKGWGFLSKNCCKADKELAHDGGLANETNPNTRNSPADNTPPAISQSADTAHPQQAIETAHLDQATQTAHSDQATRSTACSDQATQTTHSDQATRSTACSDQATQTAPGIINHTVLMARVDPGTVITPKVPDTNNEPITPGEISQDKEGDGTTSLGTQTQCPREDLYHELREIQAFWEKKENIAKLGIDPSEETQKKERKKLKRSLSRLRNSSLAVLFVSNLMWVLLLYTVKFVEIFNYLRPIHTRTLDLLFLLLYAFLMIIQFFFMLCHRIVTLVHYTGTLSKTKTPNLFYILFEGFNKEEAFRVWEKLGTSIEDEDT